MKNIKNIGILIIFFVSLVLNGNLLFNADTKQIDWSWLFDTKLHPWGIMTTNLLFSISNLIFLFLGIVTLNEKFFDKKSKDR